MCVLKSIRRYTAGLFFYISYTRRGWVESFRLLLPILYINNGVIVFLQKGLLVLPAEIDFPKKTQPGWIWKICLINHPPVVAVVVVVLLVLLRLLRLPLPLTTFWIRTSPTPSPNPSTSPPINSMTTCVARRAAVPSMLGLSGTFIPFSWSPLMVDFAQTAWRW